MSSMYKSYHEAGSALVKVSPDKAQLWNKTPAESVCDKVL